MYQRTDWESAARETLDLTADRFRLYPCMDHEHYDPGLKRVHTGDPSPEEWAAYLREHPEHVDYRQETIAWWLAADRKHVESLPNENYRKLAGAVIGTLFDQERLREIAAEPGGGF